ncbi:MAG TPA: hypothetical protein VGF30_10700 [Bacteroidia bacterium]
MRAIKLFFLFFYTTTVLWGQDEEIDHLIAGELKMTFPSIYFKHKSTDYAPMPYSADSCFKHIAAHLKDIRSFSIWRDSLETEELTQARIKKLKAELDKYTPANKIKIQSVKKTQKVSRLTIEKAKDDIQRQYLLSLNSVLDISKTRIADEVDPPKGSHINHPKIWCLNCWKRGRFKKEYRRLHVTNKKTKSQ